MASDYRVISGGTNYYLVNSTGVPTPGTVASTTNASTTPYAILDDYMPQAAERQVIYAGTPPFRVGKTPLIAGFDNKVETLRIAVLGTSHNNMVALVRLLRQILNTALRTVPAIFQATPDGATNASYYEIYSADVQETTEKYQNAGEGDSTVICRVTWNRSAFAGQLSPGETLINAVSIGNTGTGTPDNLESFSTGSGELIHDGQPINILISKSSTINATKFYLASGNRTYTADGSSYSTTLTEELKASFTFNASSFILTNGAKPRILVRLASASSNLRIRYNLAYSTSVVNTFADSEWFTPTDSGSGTTLVDMGTFDPAFFRRARGSAGSIVVRIFYGSTDGLSASATLSYVEFLQYYTFCTITTNVSITSTQVQAVDTFMAKSDRVALPLDHPLAYGALATNTQLLGNNTIAGDPPRYYSGASLYIAWMESGLHTTSQTLDVTATHAPLYHTLRGAG